MRPTTLSARIPQTPSPWRTCNADALAAFARPGSIRIEPAPWLTPRQANRLHNLLDDLLTYQSVYRQRFRIPNGYRAVESQAQEILSRFAELANAGVQLRWRPGANGTAIHLACLPD